MAKAIWDTNEQNKLDTQISQTYWLFPKKKKKKSYFEVLFTHPLCPSIHMEMPGSKDIGLSLLTEYWIFCSWPQSCLPALQFIMKYRVQPYSWVQWDNLKDELDVYYEDFQKPKLIFSFLSHGSDFFSVRSQLTTYHIVPMTGHKKNSSFCSWYSFTWI